MGYGMQRSGHANGNIKHDSRIGHFIDAAGLSQIPGLSDYLMSLPVEDVAAIDDGTWNSILNRALAGRPHNPTMNRRIQHAIHDMRVQYTKEKEEQAELAELHNLINGGAYPGRQEVREAVAAANRKQTPVDMESINFIAVPPLFHGRT